MTHTANVTGRIVALNTEHGTRYAVEVRGRIVSEEYQFMFDAAVFARKYAVEVTQ